MKSHIQNRLIRFIEFQGLILLFVFAAGSTAFAQDPYQRIVRTIETRELDIPGASGLLFSPAADAFLIMPAPGADEFTLLTVGERLAGSVNVAAAIADPLNMAMDGKANSMLFFDAAADELIEIKASSDGRPETSTEAVTRFGVHQFGLTRPLGMTSDPESGDLFFLDAQGPRIVRITPGAQDRFDGASAEKEGRISTIILNSLQGLELRGIAFNPGNGYFYVMSPDEQKLYALTDRGRIVTIHDLSSFEFMDTQGMVFAPSGDQTDDPAIQSLYIVDSGRSSEQDGIVELSLTRPDIHDLSGITENVTLVQTIHTSGWNPPSPDPAGAAYIPSSNHLLICDSEVNEMSIYAGVNVWESTLTGGQVTEFNTLSFSNEPTGVAFNPGNQHLYFTDDTGTRSVYELDPGPDGLYGTSDDITTSFTTSDFGSNDPEGIAYDTFQGHLFIADGVNAEVYEISPGTNGVFDGVPPSGDDDVVNQFDTAVLGIQDPEGVDFNPENGNLYIVSNRTADGIVLETTRNGTEVSAIDISSLNARNPGGLGYAPTSTNPSERSLYIVVRGVDNNSDPRENDGIVYEIALGSLTPSLAIDDVSVLEGNTGTVNAIFTVTLSAANSQPVTVDYNTQNGTAKAPNDYISQSGTLNFAVGETSKSVVVEVIGDVIEEGDETFFVNLSNVSGGVTIGDGQGLGTITDDDATPSLSIDDVVVAESAGTMMFTVSLSTTGSQTVSVDFTTTDGTAVSPDDYIATSGTLTIPAGLLSGSIPVTIIDDALVEDAETFTVDLSSPVNATIGDGQGIGTISANDGSGGDPVTVSFQDGVDGYSGTRDTKLLSGSPTTNYGSATTLDVDGSPDESALLFWDVTSIPIGSTIQSVDITVNVTNIASATYEIYDLKRAWIENEATWNVYASGQSWEIAGADGPGDRGFTAFGAIVGSSLGSTTASLNAAGVAAVQSWVNDPSSNHGFIVQDYINHSNGLGFSSRERSTISERPKLTVTYTSGSALPSLTIDDVTADEGVGTMSFTVSLSALSGQDVSVNYSTTDGTAVTPDDYSAASGTLTIPAGSASGAIAVTLVDDALSEGPESFTVDLSLAVNATLSDNQGTGFITDNEGLSSLVINDVTVTEGNSGTVNATFTVTLSPASAQTVTVDYATADGSAIAPGDYTAVTQTTLSFAPGATTQIINVAINGDVLDETDETFLVNLSNPVNATISDNQGQGTITDDDAAPSLSINDVTADEGVGTMSFTVSLSAVSGQDVSVNYSTTDGTAVTPDDYTAASGTLTIPAGSASGFIAVTIIDDLLTESAENFTVDLSSAVNATLSDNQGTGFITDNEGLSSLAIDDVSVTEGNNGTVNATFTVTLSQASPQTVTVDYATADGSAIAPGDYIAVTQTTLSFTPGTTTQTINVTINSDVLDETDETFLVNLSNASNATISDNQGQGTIIDDDPAPSLSINDVTADEGAGTMSFTVSLSAISGQDVSVDYTTTDGTAVASDDYTAASGTLTISAGNASGLIAVNLIDDVFAEPTEIFFVNLSNAVNAAIADNQGQASITDINDLIVEVSHQETQTGQASNSTTVATSSILRSVNGDFYIAAISSNANTTVNDVIGLGLEWILLSSQCASGNKVGLEVWIGQGDPTGDDNVTATFLASSGNTVITVSRYSGVELSSPVSNVFSGNPAGLNGSCNSNSKSSTYLFNLTTTADGAVVYNAAAATKNAQHSPGVNFTERAEISQGNGNNNTMVAVQDKTVPLSSNTSVDGLFNKSVQWAVIGLEINPAGMALRVSAPGISSTGLNKHTGKTKSKMLSREDSRETDEKMLPQEDSGKTDEKILPRENSRETGEKMLSRENSPETDESIMFVTKPEHEVEQIPQTIVLRPNYPNPFNSETRIEYAIPADSRVRIVIYNSRGQRVRKLVDETQAAGYRTVTWNGINDGGSSVSSGIYFIQLLVNNTRVVRKMILQK